MLLTASPQTMPSRDVKDAITSTLFAKVIDAKGNPVDGEVVTFTLWSYNIGAYNQTSDPSIENDTMATDIPRTVITVTTDADGLGQVTFRPGAFTRDRKDPKYRYTAQGTALIQATWRSVTHTIELQVQELPLPLRRRPCRTQDPRGERLGEYHHPAQGGRLGPPAGAHRCSALNGPVGSMLYNETLDTSKNPDVIVSESPDDRMVMAMNAAKLFVDQMNNTDRIGLVSFADASGTNGWAILYDTGSPNLYGYHWRAGRDYKIQNGNGVQYSTDDANYVTNHYPGHGASGKNYGSALATTDLNLTLDKSTVKNIVSQMVPTGGTPMRYGLYEAVKQIVNDPEVTAHRRDDAVRAIVLLTDGAWNTGGDPQGGAGADSLPGIGTGSVITWAKDNKIKIFTIALGSEPFKDQLQAYADQTGGKAYVATSGLDLNGIYSAIAGQLHTEAGVDTTMDLSFHDVEVNGALIPGLDALKYVCLIPGGNGNCLPAAPNDFISTHEFSYNLTMPEIVKKSYDQTADWAADQSLHFNVGTIFVGGVWEVNFSMKVLRDGNIKILDSNSSIKFNDGSELPLPDTYITARPDNAGNGPEGIGIWVKDLHRTDAGTSPDYVDLAWNLTYTGIEPTFREDVYLQQEGTTGSEPPSLEGGPMGHDKGCNHAGHLQPSLGQMGCQDHRPCRGCRGQRPQGLRVRHPEGRGDAEDQNHLIPFFIEPVEGGPGRCLLRGIFLKRTDPAGIEPASLGLFFRTGIRSPRGYPLPHGSSSLVSS